MEMSRVQLSCRQGAPAHSRDVQEFDERDEMRVVTREADLGEVEVVAPAVAAISGEHEWVMHLMPAT
jgi:hypothetical protein